MPMCVFDERTFDFLAVNDAAISLYGYSEEEFLRMTIMDIRPQEDVSRLRAALARLPKSGMADSDEWRHCKKDGSMIYVRVRSQPMMFHGHSSRLAVITDVTERKQAEDALRESETRLNEAQQVAGLGSWEWDIVKGTAEYSDELYRLFGFPPQEVHIDKNLLLGVIHPADRTMMERILESAVQKPQSFQCTFRVVHPGGVVRHMHGQGEVTLDANGQPIKMTGTTQDITERMLAEENRMRTAKLQMANQELEAFSYSVSHDLRTPLRGIDAFGKLLAEEYRERLDENGQSYLDLILANTRRMIQLIDDLLEFSRVTSTQIRRTDVDLSDIAGNVIEELRRAEPERNVQFVAAPALTTHSDPRLMRIVLENLLRNAWKFTGKKDAARIEFGTTQKDGQTVYFVQDNGAGFDMEFAGKLFGVFQRLHSDREFSGTGIGLAIVQRIINRHGGRIWAEAEVDKGATFYFTLPG